MTLYVSSQLFFCHCAYRRAEVSPGPQMLPPIPLLQVREFILQHPRRSPFHILHNLRRAQAWRTRHQDMHMIFANMPLQYLDIPTQATLSDQLPCPQRHFPFQHVITILCHPHKMVFDIIHAMWSLSVLWHLTSFSPILPQRRAKAIRLKAKVLDLALGK